MNSFSRPQGRWGAAPRGGGVVETIRCGLFFFVLFLSILACAQPAASQAAAEYGKAASAAASAASQAKPAIVVASPSPTKKPGSKHLPQGLQPKELAEENRRAFLENAGEQPAVVLLRSEPGGAQVWMDGKVVGETPLLLVVAPGAHVVELRGARHSRARQGIILAPDEKKEVVLSLKTRYPSQVQLH